jgi:serine/threonine protein kinase
MNILGSGAFGVVMKGTVDDGEVAVKTIKRNADKQYLKALLSELKIMIYLGNHPNIVTFLGAYTKELQKGAKYPHLSLL